MAQERPIRCGTMVLDSIRRVQEPEYAKSRQLLEQMIQEQQKNARTSRILDDLDNPLIIPVVVHVVYKDDYSNISEQQINSQIRILNQDFRRKESTDGFNSNPVGADLNIEFRLAATDPAGNPSTGITRHYSPQTYDVENRQDIMDLATIVSWPSDCYLNMWVTDLAHNYLGYAQFPDATELPGFSASHGEAQTDGVWIDYKNFGVGPTVTSTLYNGGRTTTHEIGHWLGLLHITEDDCDDDYIADTPWAKSLNRTDDVTCSAIFSTCQGVRTRNMIENYMDYSPDRCMNIFTQGQKERIEHVLRMSPRRKQMVKCSKGTDFISLTEALQVKVYAQSTRMITLETEFKGRQDVKVEIFNHLGQLIQVKNYTQVLNEFSDTYNEPLAAGVYFVRVQTATESQIRKVIIW